MHSPFFNAHVRPIWAYAIRHYGNIPPMPPLYGRIAFALFPKIVSLSPVNLSPITLTRPKKKTPRYLIEAFSNKLLNFLIEKLLFLQNGSDVSSSSHPKQAKKRSNLARIQHILLTEQKYEFAMHKWVNKMLLQANKQLIFSQMKLKQQAKSKKRIDALKTPFCT